ncbi:MAG: 3-isopropylmalate dehydrogenase [Frankiales bacterium]|nr:3-isopropylmalate dehydrogenase [Frankiales bacterium]
MVRNIRLGVIPGDGIGPEVMTEALSVLEVVTPDDVVFERADFDLGAAQYHRTGDPLPEQTLDQLSTQDVLLFGAIGDPSVPTGVLERGMLLKLRFAFDQYVNLRPCRLFPGVSGPLAAPGDVDFVVVREGTEGPYVGVGGAVRKGTPQEIATEVSVNTDHGVRRLVLEGFRRAAVAPRRRLTLVHKANVLVHAGGLWQRVVNEVSADFPDVDVSYLHVDAATIFLVTDPSRFDVIVTDNLFGDILTDLAGAICGGIGMAASGNINGDGTAPSMFEPVHGSAPDIAGLGIADPTAAVLSVALMLDHLGLTEPSRRVTDAVAADLRERAGGQVKTREVGDRIVAALRS